ncbi:MAG: RDD family protein [Planctomycetota bacterium]
MSYPIRRLLAFQLDCACIVFWGVVLFGLTMLLNDGAMPDASSPWRGQLIGLLSMTLPVLLTFTWMESSRGATLGKRLQHLRVVTSKGIPPSFRQALARNALKFLPWELGHLVAHQAFHAGDAAAPTWLYLPMVLSMALPIWFVLGLFRGGRTPYDRVGGTAVVPLGQKAGS